MRGKLAEDTKTVVMLRPTHLLGTGLCYGDIVDTKDYDEMQINLNVGIARGTTTLSAILYENSDKNIDGMVRVTGGLFPLVASGSNDSGVMVASIKTKNYKRYMALQVLSSLPTIPVAASAILAKGDSAPSGQTLQFDLGD